MAKVWKIYPFHGTFVAYTGKTEGEGFLPGFVKTLLQL